MKKTKNMQCKKVTIYKDYSFSYKIESGHFVHLIEHIKWFVSHAVWEDKHLETSSYIDLDPAKVANPQETAWKAKPMQFPA